MKTTYEILSGRDALAATSQEWDQLWQRSSATLPTYRAAPLGLWLEQFDPRDTFRAVLVRQDRQLVAALPFVRSVVAGFLEVGRLPLNEWGSAGTLMSDPDCESGELLGRIIQGIRELPWGLLWLECLVLEPGRADAFAAVAQAAGMPIVTKPRFPIGQMEFQDGWDPYFHSLSARHRRNMRRCWKRLSGEGRLRCEVHHPKSVGTARELLDICFGIEDRSWKGEAGTSVLRSPGIADFVFRQAGCLAKLEHVSIGMLLLDNRPIAFGYGWNAKQIHHSYKIGFEAEFAKFSPGHLLRGGMIKELAANSDIRSLDCLGPMSESVQKWANNSYTLSQVVLGQRGLPARAMMLAYEHAWPWFRKSEKTAWAQTT